MLVQSASLLSMTETSFIIAGSADTPAERLYTSFVSFD
jgi:hypothetical protein